MRILSYIFSGLLIILAVLIYFIGKRTQFKLPKEMKNPFTYHSSKIKNDYEMWLTAQKIYGDYCLKYGTILVPFTIIISTLFLLFIKNDFILMWSMIVLFIIFSFNYLHINLRTKNDVNLEYSKRR